MRLLSSAAAVAALSLSVAVVPAPVAAQAPSPVTPQTGSAWLGERGVTPELVTEGEEAFIRVRDGRLTWLLFFYGCEPAGCDSLQFGAGFTNEAVTLDAVNAWNRERRFLKAYFEAGDEGSAIVQYDVIPAEGAPLDQLSDHLDLWRETLNAFAVHVGYMSAPSEE